MRRRNDRPSFRFPFRFHRSALIVVCFAFLFSLSICISFGNAQEEPKPKLQEWQVNGILAALEDGYSEVKGGAFQKLAEFDAADLKAFPKQSEDIEKKSIGILKNNKEAPYVRSRAVVALGNTGKTNATVVQLLTNTFKDSKENLLVRNSAALALGNAGKTNTTVVQLLTNTFKDSKENFAVRGSAASALGSVSKIDTTAVQVLTFSSQHFCRSMPRRPCEKP